MRFLIFRLSLLLIVTALFCMVPGLVLLHFAGGWVVAGAFAGVAGLAILYLFKQLAKEKMTLQDMLFSELDMGWQWNPLITLCCGLINAGIGLMVAVNSRGIAAPPPGSTQMTSVEQCWFGITFLMIGVGVTGLGISRLLPEKSE